MPRPRTSALDETRRREICALISAGVSRRGAARYVGCAASTILDTARRDPNFAAQLRRAEVSYELGLLNQIQLAGKKSWRAAAWLLEREAPVPKGRRAADPPPHVAAEILRELVERLLAGAGPRAAARMRRSLDALIEELEAVQTPIHDV